MRCSQSYVTMNIIKPLMAVALLFSGAARAQESSGLVVLDSILRGVHSLHVVATTAKIESKIASGELRHQDAARLRSISARSNGLSGSLYHRIVPQMTSDAPAARARMSFQAFARFEIASLLKSIQQVETASAPDYPGAVMMMSAVHDEIDGLLSGSVVAGAFKESGYLCSARDQGTEEHPTAHVAVAPTMELALEAAASKCLELHASCKTPQCVPVTASLR